MHCTVTRQQRARSENFQYGECTFATSPHPGLCCFFREGGHRTSPTQSSSLAHISSQWCCQLVFDFNRMLIPNSVILVVTPSYVEFHMFEANSKERAARVHLPGADRLLLLWMVWGTIPSRLQCLMKQTSCKVYTDKLNVWDLMFQNIEQSFQNHRDTAILTKFSMRIWVISECVKFKSNCKVLKLKKTVLSLYVSWKTVI